MKKCFILNASMSTMSQAISMSLALLYLFNKRFKIIYEKLQLRCKLSCAVTRWIWSDKGFKLFVLEKFDSDA